MAVRTPGEYAECPVMPLKRPWRGFHGCGYARVYKSVQTDYNAFSGHSVRWRK